MPMLHNRHAVDGFLPTRYSYLSAEDSDLYDSVKESPDLKDRQIARLLEEKAAASKASHVACRY